MRKLVPNRRFHLLVAVFFCSCLAVHGAQSVSLAWNPDPGPQVAGYYLHFGTAPGSHPSTINVGTNVVITLSGLQAGQTYYFVVTAYNLSGIEGPPSNEAAFTVPASLPPPTAPQVNAMNPGSAAVGAPVSVYGVRFTGATSVQFNGVNASFTVSSDTLLLATVPAGAASGLLKITSPGGSVTSPFAIVAVPGPANDNFANVQVLTGNFAVGLTNTTGATKQSGEPGHAGNAGGGSVWYRWTAPATGAYSLDTVGSDFNTLLAVYTGSSLTGLSAVASNRVAAGGFTNALAFNAVSGVTYQIAVDGVNGAIGNATLHLMPAYPIVTVYSNSFETLGGFLSLLPLAGQNGWLSTGTADSGFLNNIFAGLGQQATIGYGSLTPVVNSLLYHPLNYAVDASTRPIIQFSVQMAVNNDRLRYTDIFGWVVNNAAGQELFRISFDDGSSTVSYSLDNGAGAVPTGFTFVSGLQYSLLLTMDFRRNLWSASLNGATLAANQPITTHGAALTLGNIAASEVFNGHPAPGLDGLTFDNYLVTAGPGALPPAILVGPQNVTATTGQNVVLGAVVGGGSPSSCQWYYNGGVIAGATNATLILNNATPGQSGAYALVVSNAFGSVQSAATVTITTPPPKALMAMPVCLGGTGALLNLNVSAGYNYSLQASTNLKDWVTLGSFFAGSTNALCLDPAATNYAARFYRVVSQ